MSPLEPLKNNLFWKYFRGTLGEQKYLVVVTSLIVEV